MTYSDNYNIRTKNVKFNDVADAIDGSLTRSYGGVTTGTSTTYLATTTPAWTSYEPGQILTVIPHVDNAGACTINVSALGAKAIKRGGADLVAGDLKASIPTVLVYSGTYFESLILQNYLARDGSNSMTGDLNLGGFKIKNLSAGTAALPALYSGTDSNTGVFFPSADTWAVSTGGNERLRVDSTGNIGIGTSSPGENLHLRSAAPRIRLEDSDVASTIFGQISANGGVGAVVIQADPNNAAANSYIGFDVDGTERGRFNSTQFTTSVDIRTTASTIINNASPTIYLQDTDNRSSMIHCNGGILHFLRGDAANSLGWATLNGYWPLTLNLETNFAQFGGGVSSVGDITANSGNLVSSVSSAEGGNLRLMNNTKTGSACYMWVFYNMTGGYGNEMQLWRYPASGGAVQTARWSDGGDYTQNGSITAASNIIASNILQINGIGAKFTGATIVGSDNNMGLRWSSPNIYGTVDNVVQAVLGTVSDYRLKSNFTPKYTALSIVEQIRPGSYNPVELDGGVCDKEHWGIIAHELKEILPCLVTGEKDAVNEEGNPIYQSIDYAGIVPYLIVAIQELNTKIEAINGRSDT